MQIRFTFLVNNSQCKYLLASKILTLDYSREKYTWILVFRCLSLGNVTNQPVKNMGPHSRQAKLYIVVTMYVCTYTVYYVVLEPSKSKLVPENIQWHCNWYMDYYHTT